ncbi:hypothetical protein J6590_052864 [Homalodisca vitripennis]|nr:hypothetical protein J6590_052864 [Homalodisca vitripennis]
MSTSSLDRFLYWIMFNLGTIRSTDVPKPHPGPHQLTASHNKVMFYCSRQLGAAILNTRETKKVSHIGIPSVPRFSLTGPNKSPILPKNTDFHTQNHRFYRKTQDKSVSREFLPHMKGFLPPIRAHVTARGETYEIDDARKMSPEDIDCTPGPGSSQLLTRVRSLSGDPLREVSSQQRALPITVCHHFGLGVQYPTAHQ